MPYTISTSVRGDARARRHNQRDRNVTDREAHIDPNGYYEILVDESEATAYHRLFDQAVKEYNNKQTRADRKIKNYHAKIKADPRKHTSYEMVVCIGSLQNPVDPDVGYQAMKEFVSGWQKRNPNLELIGAYYHADEDGVPGWHLDFIPVAHNFKNGPSVQTALSKALVEEGYTGGDYYYKSGKKLRQSPQIEWERAENDALEAICKKYGLEIEHPERGQAVEHLNTPKYKEMQDEVQELKDQVKQLTDEKNQLDQDISGIEKNIDSALINTGTRTSNKSLSLPVKARILKNVLSTTNSELSAAESKKEKMNSDISDLEKEIDDALIHAGVVQDPSESYFSSWSWKSKPKKMDLTEKLDKLNAAVDEADASLSKAKTEKENLQSDISALETEKANLNTDITEKRNKADSEASKTLQKANEKADSIIDDANSKAVQIINNAHQVEYHTINYPSVAAAYQAMERGEVLKDNIYMIYPDSYNPEVDKIVSDATDSDGYIRLSESEMENIKNLYGYTGDANNRDFSYKILHSGRYPVFTGRNISDGSYYATDSVFEDVNSGKAQIFADVPQNQVVLPQTLLDAIIECLEEEPDLSDEIMKFIKILSGYLPDQQLSQSEQTLDETNRHRAR